MRSGGKYSNLRFSFLSMLCMAWGYHIFHTGLVLLSNGWKWEEENQKTIRKPIMNFKLKNENEMHKKLFGEIFIRLYSWWCLLRDSQCVQSDLLQRGWFVGQRILTCFSQITNSRSSKHSYIQSVAGKQHIVSTICEN